MTQPDPDTTETRLQQLTDRFGDFADETRSNREADRKEVHDFVQESRRNQEANEQRLDEITDMTKELRNDVARLKGREYERYVSHTLLSPVSRRLGLRRPRLLTQQPTAPAKNSTSGWTTSRSDMICLKSCFPTQSFGEPTRGNPPTLWSKSP